MVFVLKVLEPIQSYAPHVSYGSTKMKWITNNPLFVCSQCQGNARPIDGRPSTTVLVHGNNNNNL